MYNLPKDKRRTLRRHRNQWLRGSQFLIFPNLKQQVSTQSSLADAGREPALLQPRVIPVNDVAGIFREIRRKTELHSLVGIGSRRFRFFSSGDTFDDLQILSIGIVDVLHGILRGICVGFDDPAFQSIRAVGKFPAAQPAPEHVGFQRPLSSADVTGEKVSVIRLFFIHLPQRIVMVRFG